MIFKELALSKLNPISRNVGVLIDIFLPKSGLGPRLKMNFILFSPVRVCRAALHTGLFERAYPAFNHQICRGSAFLILYFSLYWVCLFVYRVSHNLW